MGALLGHITGGADAQSFQPMNINFGLFPPMPESGRRRDRGDRKRRLTARALADLSAWLGPRQAAE
jgi:methylenetetrahydrofolate--tRNA-(uracil-5-)-methyltransferase